LIETPKSSDLPPPPPKLESLGGKIEESLIYSSTEPNLVPLVFIKIPALLGSLETLVGKRVRKHPGCGFAPDKIVKVWRLPPSLSQVKRAIPSWHRLRRRR
jgi:hypothetical protein